MEDKDVIGLLETETSLLIGKGVSEEEIDDFCKKHRLKKGQVMMCLLVHTLLVAL